MSVVAHVSLWLCITVVEIGAWEVRSVVFPEKLLNAFQLFTIIARYWHPNLNVLFKNITARSTKSSFESLANLDWREGLEG